MTSEPIVVTLQPLTPLWTGDAGQKGSRIRETGILGSLRWWYEAIVRGVGLYACDPTTGSCAYDEKRKLASICLACQLFGCTGYGHRFRLVVDSDGDAGNPITVRSRQSQKYFNSLNDRQSKHRGWRIPPNLAGPLTLTFRPMRPDALADFERAATYHTLRVIEGHGALGAKTSHGQGVVKIIDWSTLNAVMETDAWIGALKARPAKMQANPQPAPTLSQFVGATITLNAVATSRSDWWKAIPLTGLEGFSLGSNPNWVPSAPAIRAQLRGWLRSNDNFPSFNGNLLNERHRLMGTIQAPIGPKGADIFVTHLYKTAGQWSTRIFGFVPGGNVVDQNVRHLLSDRARLESEISSALGGLGVHVELYPDTVQALLGAGGGASGA